MERGEKQNFEEQNLRAFHEKMRGFSQRILNGVPLPPEKKRFEPDKLTDADMELWDKYEKGALTPEELKNHGDLLFATIGAEAERTLAQYPRQKGETEEAMKKKFIRAILDKNPRFYFLLFVRNLAGPLFYKRERK